MRSWGEVTEVNPNLSLINSNGSLITVQTEGNKRTVSILVNNNKDKFISFTDTIINESDDQFYRLMENGTVIEYSGGLQIKLTRKIKEAVFMITDELTASKPAQATAAPANPPISVCDEEDGIPNHHVNRFQIIAAIRPAKITISIC